MLPLTSSAAVQLNECGKCNGAGSLALPTPICVASQTERLFQFFDPHVAVADEVFGQVAAAAVDLQGDAAGVDITFFRVLEFHEPHAVDPGGDLRRIILDAGPQLVPLAVLPEAGPSGRLD